MYPPFCTREEDLFSIIITYDRFAGFDKFFVELRSTRDRHSANPGVSSRRNYYEKAPHE